MKGSLPKGEPFTIRKFICCRQCMSGDLTYNGYMVNEKVPLQVIEEAAMLEIDEGLPS